VTIPETTLDLLSLKDGVTDGDNVTCPAYVQVGCGQDDLSRKLCGSCVPEQTTYLDIFPNIYKLAQSLLE